MDEALDPARSRFDLKTRFVLGLVVLAGCFVVGLVLQRRRIEVVDTTAPDPFGSAVVRE